MQDQKLQPAEVTLPLQLLDVKPLQPVNVTLQPVDIEEQPSLIEKKEQAKLLKTVLSLQANAESDNKLVLENLLDFISMGDDFHKVVITEEKYYGVLRFAKEYFKKYKQVLTEPMLKTILNNQEGITEEARSKYVMAYQEIANAPVHVSSYLPLLDASKKKYDCNQRFNAYAIAARLNQQGKTDAADKIIANMLELVKPRTTTKKILFDTSSQLQTMDIPPIHYIVEDLIPEGLGLLVGASKSGKSAFGQQLCTCVALGKDFLNKSVKHGPVLWFCMEQYANVNKKRLEQQGLGYSDDFLILSDKDKPDMFKLNDDGLKTLRSIIVEKKAWLIVVDTYEYLAPEAVRGKNAYQQAVTDMKKIKALANDLHVCILLVIHTDKKGLKEGEDTFKEIQGSIGFMSTADFVIKLNRNRMESDGVMQITGRMDKEVKCCVKFDDNTLTWSYQKDYSDIHKGELSLRIKQVLMAEKKDLAVNDIWNILLSDYNQANTEKDHAKFKVALGRLVDDSKEVLRTGTKGHYRYSLNLVNTPVEIIEVVEAVEEEKELTYESL